MASNDTLRFGMPLLQPSQAQKHVTVNESLMRLDGLVSLVLQSVSTPQAPNTAIDGMCWGIPSGAQGDWAGKNGQIGIGSNGGWQFVTPQAGMRAFVLDSGRTAIHDGENWVLGALTLGLQGAGMVAGMVEAEVSVAAGSGFDTGVAIPAGAMVVGVVARVSEAISGSLSSWRLGTSGAATRFGQGLGKSRGSWSRGILGSPMTYYDGANLLMSAEGGDFSGGRVRLAAHWWELRLPS